MNNHMIRYIKRGVAAALLALAAATVSAIDLPVTSVNGKDYYYYDVQPQETLFSLSQRLGISREQIVEYNPGVDAGLKAYTRLYFPVESGVSAISAGDRVTTSHKVGKGETLYGISKKYGISVDRLIASNPSARDGVKQGDILVIDQDNPVTEQPVAAPSNGGTHTIAAGETLYRIAVNNGMTVEQLLAANPDLDAYNYSEGTVINIPANVPAANVPDAPHAAAPRNNIPEVDADLRPVKQASEPTWETPQATPDTPASGRTTADMRDVTPEGNEEVRDADTPFNIAVMLPFHLNEETPGKEAENFTEFYRGFLMAAEDMDKKGRKVNIHAYDTQGDVETVKELMGREEMKDMDVFVTPATVAELDYIISQIDGDRQFVFNNFAVRNTAYKDNPNVIQANIPHTQMYQRAIDAFMTEMEGRTPIFVQRIGATADKEEFTSMLKSQLSDKGITFKEITYDHSLKDDDFAEFDKNEAYVIVPLSSSAAEFNKMVPALKRFKDTLVSTGGLSLFGYPEWLTFRGDRKDNLGALNATIYSRFYLDDTYYPARRLAESYRTTYGREMNSAVPSQAFMGYDVASYLIKSLRANNGDFHLNVVPFDGLQSDFIFSDSDCEGLVNTSVELIKFSDGGFTEHRNI